MRPAQCRLQLGDADLRIPLHVVGLVQPDVLALCFILLTPTAYQAFGELVLAADLSEPLLAPDELASDL